MTVTYVQVIFLLKERAAQLHRIRGPYAFPKWRSSDPMSASLVASVRTPELIPDDSRLPQHRISRIFETEAEAQDIKVRDTVQWKDHIRACQHCTILPNSTHFDRFSNPSVTKHHNTNIAHAAGRWTHSASSDWTPSRTTPGTSRRKKRFEGTRVWNDRPLRTRPAPRPSLNTTQSTSRVSSQCLSALS